MSGTSLNRFNSDKFNVVFSNIPQPYYTKPEDKVEMAMFDNFVKNFSLPGYSVEFNESMFGAARTYHPVSRLNTNLNIIGIEFFADENLDNYYTLWQALHEIKMGRPSNKGVYLKDWLIDSIVLNVKDNENRITRMIKYERCLLESLSDLSLVYGVSDEIRFVATFVVHNQVIEKFNYKDNAITTSSLYTDLIGITNEESN